MNRKIIETLIQGKAGRWTKAYHLKVPPPPIPPQPPRGGPRQRILPTPRGVNMIAWSLDNRFVLAAIMGKLHFMQERNDQCLAEIMKRLKQLYLSVPKL